MPAAEAAPATASDERIYRRNFWLGAFDARILARFRIAFAAVLIWDVLERLRDFHTFYTDRGMFPRGVVFAGPWWNPARWSIFMLGGDALTVGVLYALGVLALVALLVGYRTRWAAVLSWIFITSLQRRSPWILDGADGVERVMLFWLMWADAGGAASLDVRLGRRTPAQQVAALPVRLLQLQIAAIYFFTALGKSDIGWYSGAALGRILQLVEFARPTAKWLLAHPSLCKWLSVTIPPLEAAIAILMLSPWRRARYLAIAGSVALHVSIFVFMDVGMFSLLMPITMILALPTTEHADGERVRLRRPLLVPAALMALGCRHWWCRRTIRCCHRRSRASST